LSNLLSHQKGPAPFPSNPGSNLGNKQAAGGGGGVGGAYSRLKNGTKSVIIAVVDEGIVSYIRWADSDFSREKMYERSVGAARGKGGGGRGRGGARGRGRGRGR